MLKNKYIEKFLVFANNQLCLILKNVIVMIRVMQGTTLIITVAFET